MKRGENISEKLMNEKYSTELCFVPVHRYSSTILSKQMFPRDLFTGLRGQINTLPKQDTSLFF